MSLISEAFLLLSVLSCNRSEKWVQAEFVDIDPDRWSRSESLYFSVDSTLDLTEEYEPFLIIRLERNYPYQDLWLAVNQASLDGVQDTDTIRIPVSDKDGKWLGKSLHNIVEISFPVRPCGRLPEGYELSVRHVMRDESLVGVMNLGIILTKCESGI